jgi:hypothetical protein
MPEINFSTVDVDKAMTDLNHALKEAAYIVVGLGVLAFQRAQVRRVELTKQFEEAREQISTEQLETQWDTVRAQLVELAKLVDEWLIPARTQIGEQMDLWGERLPEPARNLVQTVRETASSREQTLRNVVGLN